MSVRARWLPPMLAAAWALGCFLPSPGEAQHESLESWETVGFSAPQGSSRARLRTALDPNDPDTVYVGHVYGFTGLPGSAGGAGPFHIGRGGYRVTGSGTGAANNGYWDWDRFNAGELDSLQGWWPLERGIGTTGGVSVSDVQRPFHGLDHGNLGCYAINQAWPQRTFGVTGYWHRDPGANVPGLPDSGGVVPGPGVEWMPLSGAHSAWCGLRGHGDLTVTDAITGNPYSQTVIDRSAPLFPGQLFGSLSTSGTDRNYPGYGSQWDQMLYRDVVVAEGGSFDLQFTFRAAMDTRAVSNPAVRVGWFDKDPLKPVAAFDGNFISSTDAGAQAPVDSFMVYVGVPTSEADCLYSDGVRRPMFDPLRRWFSEVIAIDQPHAELMSVAGTHAATTVSIPLVGGPGTLIQDILDADGTGNGGRVRVVFRVKTNRGYDDGDHGISGFSSGTAGAVILDDVVVNGWDPSEGDFESPIAIDNQAAPELAWRSTGKPPGIFFHPHTLTTLPFADPCGAIGSAARQCNMTGRVLTPGDHDQGERPGGAPGSPTRDRHDLAGSPTINLRSLGPGDYNAHGIDAEIADATGDLKMVFDLYTGGLKGSKNGNYYQVAWQSYPARQANGLPVWGEIRMPAVVSSFSGTQCLTTVSRGARFDNALVTSNPSGVPDSLRIYLQHITRCFSLPIAAIDCSPATGPDAGIYFDNLALAFIDAPGTPSLSFNTWDLFNDTFPATRDDSLLALPFGAAFDTCAAHVRTALNIAAPGGLNRPQIPGDTMVVLASGAGQRVDLVFRIFPGVGNYVTIGDKTSGIATRPDLQPRVAALPGDGSWFGAYMMNNGAFGTGAPMDGVGAGPGHPGGVWDPNRWNSARCDTAERNLFPAAASEPNLSQLTVGAWATMLHEEDPHYAQLGIPRPRCFLVSTGPGAPVDDSNITCGSGAWPPAWTGNPQSGFDPNEIPGQPGHTREYTKIIPDGLLTPGAHVQYFFRKSALASPGTFQMAPDTFAIVPQPVANDLDGHRWQQFSVLPDRWKDPAFGGQGMACMLFVDFSDRRGEELQWVSIMDSIGGTAPGRRGAHNGWKARGDQVPGAGVNPLNGGDPTLAVPEHLGQPGTVWDLYSVHGAESGATAGSFANRLAAQPAGPLASRTASHGPSAAMLRAMYRMLVLDFGDLGTGGTATLGPYAGKSDDDIGLLQAYAAGGSGLGGNRAVWALGRSFAESQNNPATGHPGFTEQFFAAGLRSPSYRSFTGSTADVADLKVLPPIAADLPLYGVLNTCQIDLDLLSLNPSVPGASATSTLNDGTVQTGLPPFIAGVRAPPSASHPHFSQLDAFRLPNLGSRLTLTRGGAHRYLLQALTGLFGSLNCAPLSSPIGVGDMPGSAGAATALLTLRSANPWRQGEARITFRLAHTGQADLRVYDLAGRCVRRLVDRRFAGGTDHEVIWDGADDRGRPLPDGVYFYRLRSPSFVSERKLTLLRR